MPDIAPGLCQHLQAITEIKLSDEHVCEECIKQGTTWFHLRTAKLVALRFVATSHRSNI